MAEPVTIFINSGHVMGWPEGVAMAIGVVIAGWVITTFIKQVL
jgi:hypothetical protein